MAIDNFDHSTNNMELFVKNSAMSQLSLNRYGLLVDSRSATAGIYLPVRQGGILAQFYQLSHNFQPECDNLVAQFSTKTACYGPN